jgi:hypothetical protein
MEVSGSETCYDNSTGLLTPFGKTFIRKKRSPDDAENLIALFNIFNTIPSIRAKTARSVGFEDGQACMRAACCCLLLPAAACSCLLLPAAACSCLLLPAPAWCYSILLPISGCAAL